MSGPNYHRIKFFSESLLAIEKLKRKKANKPVYLDLLIIELWKIVIYEFSYDHLKPEYGENPKVCCMNRDKLIIYIKADDTYKDIAANIEKRFDT